MSSRRTEADGLERCAHCEQDLAGVQVVDGPTVSDVKFCCSGCATIWAVLHEAGLESYYRTRERLPDPATVQATLRDQGEASLDDPDVASRLLDGDVATFAIDGMHCASCGWVIERLLSQDPSVSGVSVSVGREQATVHLVPDASTAPPLGRLARRLASAGYRAHPVQDAAEDPVTAKRRRIEVLRLGIAAACTMNIMLFAVSMYGGDAWGMDPALRSLFRWLSLALALPIVGFSAAPILRRAASALSAGVIHVDVPVALAILVMFGASATATVRGGEVWFDSLGMLVVLLLGGRALDSLARRRTAQRLNTLLRHQDVPVPRLREGSRELVPSDTLQPGDVIELAPGHLSPIDGRVVGGRSEIDLSVVDGESIPHLADVGAEIPAGARVLDGLLRVEVTRPAAASNVARVRSAVERALSRRGPTELLADRAARWFVGAVLLIAAITAVTWSQLDPSRAMPVVVAVLVVACPCALALATPLSFAAAVHGAASRGLLVRDGSALARLGQITQVAFDKTGTLTDARLRPGQLGLEPAGETLGDDQILRLAAATCRGSRHPVAEAVVQAWRARTPGPLPPAEQVLETAGEGVQALVSGRTVRVGRPGATITIDDVLVGRLALHSNTRPDAAEAVRTLADLGLRSTLLSGDEVLRAQDLGAQVGIHDVHGAMTPVDKARWIDSRQRNGERVAFVGDGLNDAPGLAEAFSGLAMGGAVDLALEAADGALVSRRPLAVAEGVRLGRRLRRTLRTNIGISVAYNTVAIAAAAAGLITPLLAALLMPLSSLVVILNAARLAGRPD